MCKDCKLWLSHTHTHTYRLTALCPGLPGWAGTRKVKPIWILLKQETVSGSGISWAICKSAPHSRHITTPTPHRSVFYRPDALPATQPTASKHWRHINCDYHCDINNNNHSALPARHYASVDTSCGPVSVCLFLSQVGVLSSRLNKSSWFWHGSFLRPILHCVIRKFRYRQK